MTHDKINAMYESVALFYNLMVFFQVGNRHCAFNSTVKPFQLKQYLQRRTAKWCQSSNSANLPHYTFITHQDFQIFVNFGTGNGHQLGKRARNACNLWFPLTFYPYYTTFETETSFDKITVVFGFLIPFYSATYLLQLK